MFLKNNFNSIVPQMDLTTDDLKLMALITREINAYISSLESLRYIILHCGSSTTVCGLCAEFVMEYDTSLTFLVLVMLTYKPTNHGS